MSRTLPSGQVINHEYGLGQGPGASWHKVTTGISPNFRWTKTVFDGFGRTLEVISGHKVVATETAVSKVLTEYTPCACSSIGKVKRTSMPFAASGSPAHWTTYDLVGRPVTGKRFSSLGVADVCARVTTTSRSQGLDGSFPIGPRRAG